MEIRDQEFDRLHDYLDYWKEAHQEFMKRYNRRYNNDRKH